MKRMITGLGVCIGLVLALAQIERSPSVEGAEAYFINLVDGDTVSSPFLLQFGLKGMGVAPAGADFEATGHHHLLVNLDESTLDLNAPLPSTDNLLHFGAGQTETMLELPPGEHTLQLLLGNYSHIPHAPEVISEKITVTVTE